MMLTAKSTEYDKVIGLDAGADDYVTKPFGTMELIARVKALLRRTAPPADEKVYQLGKLAVNPAKHTVTVADSPVTLTLKEFELLVYLFKNQGNVVNRDQILQEICRQLNVCRRISSNLTLNGQEALVSDFFQGF